MSDLTQEEMKELLRKKKEKIERLRQMRLRRKKGRAAAAATAAAAAAADPEPRTEQVPEPKAEAKEEPGPVVSPRKNLANTADAVLKDIAGLIPKASGRKVQLGFSKTKFSHNIQPAPRVIKYDKGIQIELPTENEKKLEGELTTLRTQISKGIGVGTSDEVPEKIQPEIKTIDQEREEERAALAELLPLAERKRIMRTEKFMSFFRGSSKIIERALTQNEDFDVTIDYSEKEEKDDLKEEAMISAGNQFTYGMRTQNRAVTSITWSPKHKDLFLTSYAAPQMEHLSMDPDGLVLVWSTHTPTRPEYILSCQSAVLVAQFHPVKPNIVIAGTKSGQVIVWDLSVKTTPINRTSLSQGHTHPVYSMACVPAVNKAYSILSISTDGHACIWQDTDHLEEPSMELDLQFVGRKGEVKDRDITTTCFGFIGRDSNSLILGSDEGFLYKARIYEAPNAEAGINYAIPAHVAPISNISFRAPIKGLPTLMSELYITSSFDWTIKLWHKKTNKPLLTFERCRDYVYDVQWSPVHPALFATGDGNGILDIWNLNNDTELPTQSIHAAEKDRTISKLSFSNDGRKIAVGSSSGSVRLFNLNENLASPMEEDAKKFYEFMQVRLQLAAQKQSKDIEIEKLKKHYHHGISTGSGLQSITSILNKKADRA